MTSVVQSLFSCYKNHFDSKRQPKEEKADDMEISEFVQVDTIRSVAMDKYWKEKPADDAFWHFQYLDQ